MHGDWHALGEVQYRKWAAYEPLNWDPNLRIDEYVVAGASYGGPIAMVRDHRRLMPLAEADAPQAPPVLRLYSSAGTTLAEVLTKWVVHKITFDNYKLGAFIPPCN